MKKKKIHYLQLQKYISLYIDLNLRKVSEFEKEKSIIMDEFTDKHKKKFKSENLYFSSKLKK